MKKANGFTIVELLIVIVVIGILAAISIVAYNNVAAKARDSQRLQDMRTISKALEMYYIDNGRYPSSSGSTTINSSWSATVDGSWQHLAEQLEPYLGSLPVDPVNNGSGYTLTNGYGYSYFTNSSAGLYCGASGGRQFYYLGFNLEATDRVMETSGVCSGSNQLLYSASSFRAVR